MNRAVFNLKVEMIKKAKRKKIYIIIVMFSIITHRNKCFYNKALDLIIKKYFKEINIIKI
jgi:hypothetical protein